MARSQLPVVSYHETTPVLFRVSLAVALVCMVFLFHFRSALVAILTLPLGILMAFIAMRFLGLGADIMSLGGIAIAIGAMIDAAIVMIENMHKHLERDIADKRRRFEEAGNPLPGDPDMLETSILTSRERWGVVARSAKEVGPALFFSLLIITVSFVPVFSLEAQEGRLFKPLAWTKTLSMAAASLLSITMVPVAMGLFIRGRIHPEHRNPVYRLLVWVYRPILEWVLRYRWPVVAGALSVFLLTYIPMQRIGSEFMPPLNEGTILYMPSTLPGISVSVAADVLRRQDSILVAIPEVVSVFGKAGRADTATDPAPLEMFETTIMLKDEREWREGMTMERLVEEMDSLTRLPGVTNSWTMPIKGRIDMLATGIRTPVGIKIFGPDLAELERIGKEIESAIRMVSGTRSVIAERPMSGSYLDIKIDREAAARYGLNVGHIQMVIASAIGGMEITQTVEGRERYGVRVRYPQELRDQPEKLAEVLIPVTQGLGGPGDPTGGSAPMSARMGGGEGMGGYQIPLGQVATISTVAGPMGIKTEGAFPTSWVFVDVADRDIGSYVAEARGVVEQLVELPAGYTVRWSGQYEYMQRAQEKLMLVVPATLLIIFLLLYLNFKRIGETMLVMLTLPFSLVGGVLIMVLLGYNWSVATGVGFIALAGVAAETAVIMLLYLNQSWDARQSEGKGTPEALQEAVLHGAVLRVRPLIMTVTAIIGGLLPILWGHGTGASVMKRIAAPMVGGMLSATVLTLLAVPACYSLMKEWSLAREGARGVTGVDVLEPELVGAD